MRGALKFQGYIFIVLSAFAGAGCEQKQEQAPATVNRGLSSVTATSSTAPESLAAQDLSTPFDPSHPTIPIHVKGTLRTISIDLTNGTHLTYYYLVQLDPNTHIASKMWRLQIDPAVLNSLTAQLQTNAPIEVDGQTDGYFITISDAKNIQIGKPSADPIPAPTSTPSPQPIGSSKNPQVRKVGILIVNFPNEKPACDKAALEQTVFGRTQGYNPFSASLNTKAFYENASYGGASLDGGVLGTVQIPAPGNLCTTFNWEISANQAAQAAGIDISGYDHLVYVLPESTGKLCNAAGIGDIGGKAVWITSSCYSPEVYAHELGHNLGLYHASSYEDEYGDFSDVMGDALKGGLRDFNAPHKAQLGWIPTSAVQPISQWGTYLVDDSETESHGNQILTVNKADTAEQYMVSFRKAVGTYDVNLANIILNFINYGAIDYVDSTNIHLWRGSKQTTVVMAALNTGDIFYDPANHLRISQVGMADQTAKVEIDFNVNSASDNTPQGCVTKTFSQTLKGLAAAWDPKPYPAMQGKLTCDFSGFKPQKVGTFVQCHSQYDGAYGKAQVLAGSDSASFDCSDLLSRDWPNQLKHVYYGGNIEARGVLRCCP